MRSSRGRGDRSGDGSRAGSNQPSPGPWDDPYYNGPDLADIDFSGDSFNLPAFLQGPSRFTSASPQPSIRSHGSLSIRPSPAPPATGNSRDGPAPTPPYQQAPTPAQRSGEHEKRPRRDNSSSSSSSSRPDRQRPKHSHRGEGPVHTQGPAPQPTWSQQPQLQGMSSTSGMPSMGMSAGGTVQYSQGGGGSSYQQHSYVSQFERDPANLASFQSRQTGGYAPQTQGGSSAQAYKATVGSAPVVEITDSPGPIANPPPDPAVPPHRRRKRPPRHGEEGGGPPPAQARAPAAAPVPEDVLGPRVRWDPQNPTIFEVDKTVPGRNFSEREMFELKVIAAGHVSYGEIVDRGQDLPGKRKLDACARKYRDMRKWPGVCWTEGEDDLIREYMDKYGGRTKEQRKKEWDVLVEKFRKKLRAYDEVQARLNLFKRWGGAMGPNNDQNLGRGQGMTGPGAWK